MIAAVAINIVVILAVVYVYQLNKNKDEYDTIMRHKLFKEYEEKITNNIMTKLEE